MIRLVLILCASLITTFWVAGGENGQRRLGLSKELAIHNPAPPSTGAAESPLLAQAALANPANSGSLTPAALRPQAQQGANRSEAQIGDVKYVQGRSVNIRSGPSTHDAVVGKLRRGEAVSILWVENNGWARIRLEGDGVDGFMSMDFLSDEAP